MITKQQLDINFKKHAAKITEAAKKVFEAMAAEEITREIVERYQKKILANNDFKYAAKYSERNHGSYFGRVLNIEDAWMMENLDFEAYLEQCKVEKEKNGYGYLPEDYCPLLTAEQETLKAKNNLFEISKLLEFYSESEYETLRYGMDLYKKYIEIILKMAAPYIKK